MSFHLTPLPAKFGNDFENEFSYANNRIYLNNASVSLMPRSSIDAMSAFLTDYNMAGPDSALANELVTEKMNNVRKILSEILSCKPDEIVLTQSTTDGINMVANGLDSLRAGCNVIIRGMEHEHRANLYPWLYLRNKGIQIRSLAIDPNGFFDIGELESMLDDGATRLVVQSHALYNTGAVLPVSEVGRMICDKNNNCRFFVDAAQTVGCMDMHDCDVSDIKCDYMSFNGSKWLCGPMGMGLFYCSREAGRSLNPVTVGGESAVLDDDDDDDDDDGVHLSFKDAPTKFQTGFRNYAGVVGLEASAKYLKKIGFGKIRAKNQDLSKLLHDGLDRLPGVETFVPADPKQRTSIVSFNIAEQNPQHVVKRLEKQGIILTVRELGKLEMIRASPHFYNTEAQIHELIRVLKQQL